MKCGDNRGGMCSRAISFAFSSSTFFFFFSRLTRAFYDPFYDELGIVTDHTTPLAFPLLHSCILDIAFFFTAFPVLVCTRRMLCVSSSAYMLLHFSRGLRLNVLNV